MTSSGGVERISSMRTDMNHMEYQFEFLLQEEVFSFRIVTFQTSSLNTGKDSKLGLANK